MARALAMLTTLLLLALLAAPAGAAPEAAGSRLLRFAEEPTTLRIVALRRLDDAGTVAGVAELRTSGTDGTIFAAGEGRLVFRATYDRASGRLEGRGAFEYVGDIRDGTTNTLVTIEARGRLSYMGEVQDGTDIFREPIPVNVSGLMSQGDLEEF